MKRLAACCGLSVVLYVLLFGVILDRPLSLGLLRLEISQKAARLAALPSPKLVILAGSNAPYSHSCVIIGAMLKIPCENAGIAVGIGVDNLFLRDQPFLHAGDIIYMPMETDQFIRSRPANRASPDAAMLLRHNLNILHRLPPDRILGAVFCCTLADALESLAEMPIAQAGLMRPQTLLAQQFNPEGDRIGAALAGADKQLLQMPAPAAPNAASINAGYGTKLITRFIAEETTQNVIIIGGLPTQFQDVALPPATIGAIKNIYTKNGGLFITLPNNSEYPRADFYDSKDHLAQPCQFLHSIAIARAVAAALHKPVLTASAEAQQIAGQCPSL